MQIEHVIVGTAFVLATEHSRPVHKKHLNPVSLEHRYHIPAMSFNSLKSARKAKELHSFIQTRAEAPHQSPPSVSQTASEGSPMLKESIGLEGSSPNSQVGAAEPSISAAEKSSDPDSPSKKPSEYHPSKTNTALPESPAVDTVTPPLTSTSDRRKTKLVPLQGCHAALPPTIEIRESNRHGRGIYAKFPLSAGACR